MASKPLYLSVRPRGKPIKKLPEEISVIPTDSTSEIYQTIARKANTSIHRLRVTKGSDGSLVPNAKNPSINDTGLRDQSTIYVKDLGPQISWRTVFLLEYLGPLFIHPLIYSFFASHSSLQTLTLLLITSHFAKRELETLFIHRFSVASMPFFNIFRNCAFYWLAAGINVAFWTYRSTAPAASPSNPYITYPAILLFIVGELGNLSAHLTLRGLRSSGGTERGIPQGWAFELVTCPNYMFEIMAWVGIALVSWSLSTIMFLTIGVSFMGAWGKKKEAKYRKEFGGRYRKKRFVMLPGIW